MKYKILFLPVDKPLEDGCDIINSSGEHFIYDETSHYWQKEGIKRAELFLVSMEFNQMIAIGKPDPSLKWLKHGMDVKAVDCELWGALMRPLYSVLKWWRKIDDAKVEPEEWEYGPTGENIYGYSQFELFWRVRCPTCGILH